MAAEQSLSARTCFWMALEMGIELDFDIGMRCCTSEMVDVAAMVTHYVRILYVENILATCDMSTVLVELGFENRRQKGRYIGISRLGAGGRGARTALSFEFLFWGIWEYYWLLKKSV